MRKYFKQLLTQSIVFTLIVSLLFSPTAAFAATYGSGAYGACNYNTGCTTTSSSNPISSAISSAGSAIAAFFCSDQAPASSPNLFQVDVTGTTAKLYFAPPSGSYNKHYIAYGQGNDSEGYGVEFATDHSTGALNYTVKQLKPSNVYTFKIRGGNGCKPGS